VGARPMSAAPAANSASPASSARRRPSRSLSRPPPQEPTAAPASAALTMNPSIQLSLRWTMSAPSYLFRGESMLSRSVRQDRDGLRMMAVRQGPRMYK